MARDTRNMRTLYLLRHAKAVPAEEYDGPDRERPLEKRGRKASQAIADWVAEQRLAPALALCSASMRTRQTLDIVAPSFKHLPEVRLEEGLYLADARQLLARLREVPGDTESVVMVGHNPGFHELAILLSEVTTGPLIARLGNFPTGALVIFAIEVPWSALGRRTARLTEVVLPKEL